MRLCVGELKKLLAPLPDDAVVMLFEEVGGDLEHVQIIREHGQVIEVHLFADTDWFEDEVPNAADSVLARFLEQLEGGA